MTDVDITADGRRAAGWDDLEPGAEQSWLLDYLVRVAGRTWNMEEASRWFPPDARSEAMIPSAFERGAERAELMARAADKAGNADAAIHLYFQASRQHRHAAHAIDRDDDPQMTYFYERVDECYDRIIELSPNPIERAEIEWEGHSLAAIFHPLPDRRRAPTLVSISGLDSVKEQFPDPTDNIFLRRGVNVLSFDGPGQGIANLRKTRLDARNFERAAKTVIDWLSERPEVDPEQIVVMGTSLGSFHAIRTAAADERVKAVACVAGGFNSMGRAMRIGPPNYRKTLAYNTGVHDPAKLVELADQMNVDDAAPRVTCPLLLVVGEYDALSPLHEVYAMFQSIPGPKELWVVEGEVHDTVKPMPNFGGLSSRAFVAHWLRQAIDGEIPSDLDRALLVRRGGTLGPYDKDNRAFWYPERALPR